MISGIHGENFQSWKSLKFHVESGVTLIDGFNFDDNTPEGSGKSAILNAMCWGIYGKLPKEANVDDVVKDGEKGCLVEVFLDHPIVTRICRSRKPNDLAIVDINQKTIKGKDVRETQKMIEEIVGLSFDAFCQTIYFAQGWPKKFVTATQEDRGKILSEIQNLEVFEKARKEAMSLIKVESGKITGLEHDLNSERIKLDSNVRMIQQQQQFIAKQKQDLAERITTVEAQRQSKTNQLDDLGRQRAELVACHNPDALQSLGADRMEIETIVEEKQAVNGAGRSGFGDGGRRGLRRRFVRRQ